jgi:hypothetical protein
MLGADEDDEELPAEGGEEDQEEEPNMEARLPNMEAESPNLEEELGSVEGFALEMALLTEGSQAPRLAAVDVRIEWLESVLSPHHIRLLTSILGAPAASGETTRRRGSMMPTATPNAAAACSATKPTAEADAGTGSIFHLISHEFGAQTALSMIYALQQMSISFVANCGFTVGTGDMAVTPAGVAEIQAIIAGVLRESELITERLVRGELIPPIRMSTHEYFEALQREALKNPDDLLRPVVGSIDPDRNGLFKMVATGSKGSTPNLMHIMGVIGQIELNTQRIAEQFSFRRTNVYFPRFATSAEAYGFVKNSYVSGMTSPEYIFSDMNGRFDLINKALTTASTGYANRKAIMALQSDIVDNYRHLAKDTCLVQVLYGEDGLDTRRVERVRFRTVFATDAGLEEGFRLDLAAAKVPGATREAQAVFDEAFARIRADRDAYRAAFRRFEDSDFTSPMSDVRQMPVNVARLVSDVRIAREAAARPAHTARTLVGMARAVADFCDRLPYVLVNEIQERRGTPLPRHLEAATGLLRALIRAEL